MAEAAKVTIIMCAVALVFWFGLAVVPKSNVWIGLYAVLFIVVISWVVGIYAGGVSAANHLVKTMAIMWGGLFLIAGLAYLMTG